MSLVFVLATLLASLPSLAQRSHRSAIPLYVEPVSVAPPTRPVTEGEVVNTMPATQVAAPAPAQEVESILDRLPRWWPLLALLGVWLASAVYRGRRTKIQLPERLSLGDPIQYDTHHGCGELKKLESRSPEACRTEYIDTVRAQVKRLVGRSDIRCISVPLAPLEMRWRAWMGAADYQLAHPDLRASGRTEGQALKSLLATYQRSGGNWTGFAVERERPTLRLVSEPVPPEPIQPVVLQPHDQVL